MFIESRAAVSIGMGEAGATQGARRQSDQMGGIGGARVFLAQVLNSGMSGLDPQAQNDVDLNGNLRGR